jgi:DOPA 4,5-dioxygenase
MQTLAAIHSYHAHIYYDPARTRGIAEALRARIAERFSVQLGRWHDVPVGPHTAAMYQVAFDTDVFAAFVPWLMLNRNGLDVLVHPNTLAPRDDHLQQALWLGDKLALKESVLPQRIDADQESPVEANTTPHLAP